MGAGAPSCEPGHFEHAAPPLAEALAEDGAYAAADARGEEVVELADDAAAARAEAEHVGQEAHDDDQQERGPHRPPRCAHVSSTRGLLAPRGFFFVAFEFIE